LKCEWDAGDDDVHLGEGRVVEVQGAVGEDVDLDAGENSIFPFISASTLRMVLDVGEGAGRRPCRLVMANFCCDR